MELSWRAILPLIPAVAAARLCLAPMHLGWKLLAHTVSGLLSLWLINLVGGYTGILLPINGFTAAIAGFLGLPGIALLIWMQA